MKRIIINEEQWVRLVTILERNGAPEFTDSEIKEYPGSEVSTTAVIHDPGDNPKYGKQPTTDKISNELSPQGWMASHRAGRGPRF